MIRTFIREPKEYKRSIAPVEHAIEQLSLMTHKLTGWPMERCKEYVWSTIKANRTKRVRDPTVTYYQRGENGDREKLQSKLTGYIAEVVRDKEVLAPSFTTYRNSGWRKSLLSIYTKENADKRGVIKKQAQAAKAKNDLAKFAFLNAGQTNAKLANNAVSGALVALGSVIHNPTGHSSLTSTVRTGTSFGNGVNERMLDGNRHYRNPDIVMANIVSIISSLGDPNDASSLYNRIQAVMTKYGFHYPSVNEVVSVIEYSSSLYWRNKDKLNLIRSLVAKLDPIERCFFVYNGDMYHLRVFNDAFMREFFFKMTERKTDIQPDPVKLTYSFDGAILSVAHEINADLAIGKGLDYSGAFTEDGSIHAIASTAKNINETILLYADMIDVFFVTKDLPPSIAYIYDMVRGVVALSDTDSTGAAAAGWVQWYFGKVYFHREAYAVSSVASFMATQAIAHALATYSANLGVAEEHLHAIAMKNEFTFPVIVPTDVAKHYYANKTVQEGAILAEPEEEIKGVHLKSSNVPSAVMDHSTAMMIHICNTVSDPNGSGLISQEYYLREFANKEREIQESLLKGELIFYRGDKINEKEAYSLGPLLSKYQHHTLWEMCFAEKYGYLPIPSYDVIKVPTIMASPTKTREAIDNIPDRALAHTLVKWMVMHNRKDLPTLYLPTEYVKSNGMVPEIAPLIDTKRIITDLTGVNRLILNSIGFNIKEDSTLMEMGY